MLNITRNPLHFSPSDTGKQLLCCGTAVLSHTHVYTHKGSKVGENAGIGICNWFMGLSVDLPLFLSNSWHNNARKCHITNKHKSLTLRKSTKNISHNRHKAFGARHQNLRVLHQSWEASRRGQQRPKEVSYTESSSICRMSLSDNKLR